MKNDDLIKCKHFLLYWPFVWGIHRWPVNSPHIGQWGGALLFPLICAWTKDWANNRDVGDFSWFELKPSRPFWRQCNASWTCFLASFLLIWLIIVSKTCLKYRNPSKAQYICFELVGPSGIWQGPSFSSKVTEQFENFKIESRGFETSGDLLVRQLGEYWSRIQQMNVARQSCQQFH